MTGGFVRAQYPKMKKSAMIVTPVLLFVLCFLAVKSELPAEGDGHGGGHGGGTGAGHGGSQGSGHGNGHGDGHSGGMGAGHGDSQGNGHGSGPGNGHGGSMGGGHGGSQGTGHSGGNGQESCVCTRNEYFIRASFNRTCTQDLLREVKTTVDHISRDVKQVASTQRELQQQIHRLATAQETSTNELKYLISQGFEQLARGIAENKQLILRESANVISSQQRAISELREVTITMSIFHHFLNFQRHKMF